MWTRFCNQNRCFAPNFGLVLFHGIKRDISHCVVSTTIVRNDGSGRCRHRLAAFKLSDLQTGSQCNFSSRKTPPKDAKEAQQESEDKDVEKIDEESNDDAAHGVGFKSILDASARVIFQSLGKDPKSKRHGRQVQDGKIRKLPIPIKLQETDPTKLDINDKENDQPEEGEEQQQDTEDGHTEDDHQLTLDKRPSVHFTLPILHFKSSGRFHALPALGLYRKPAFPGFYQVLQVQDQSVLQTLSTVKQNGGHDYIGGFLTREDLSRETSGQLLPSLRDDAGAVGNIEELHSIGTLLQIITITPHMSLQGGQVILMPHKRIKLTGIHAEPSENCPLYRVAVEYMEDAAKQLEDSSITKALHLEIIATVKELIKTSNFYKEHFDQIIRFYNLDYPTRLADLIAGISMAKRNQLQAILAEMDIDKRLQMVLQVAKNDLEFAKVQAQVKSQIEDKLSKEQRRYILTEQLKMIKRELGMDYDDKNAVIEAFEADFEKVKEFTSEEMHSAFKSGIARLRQLEISSAEFGVARSHLEWLLGLPWGKYSAESRDLSRAQAVLDEKHFGLKDVKQRLLEYMATGILRQQSHGKIICLVGPPGVGKTSVAIAMAEALNRKMYRFSLGGLFDVAELRGHRRTYVGALPGKFVQALKYTGTMNPLIVLDEIDKLGRDARGDPASALLEVLDPSQNTSFRDHYLDISIDLSKVLFVCTANSTDPIPSPLLDRMEIITIPGYLPEEKMAIAKVHLVPKIQADTGIDAGILKLPDETIEAIITKYSREAGVRGLEKQLEKIFRRVALDVVRYREQQQQRQQQQEGPNAEPAGDVLANVESVAAAGVKSFGSFGVGSRRFFSFRPSGGTLEGPAEADYTEAASTSTSTPTTTLQTPIVITPDDLVKYLGIALFTRETLHPYPLPFGVVMGLAWTNAGGATMYVEAHGQLLDKFGNVIEPTKHVEDLSSLNLNHGSGSLKTTGQLGSVMAESSQIALTYCRSFLRKLQPNNVFLNEAHLHIHVPEGATPKDGPSGGITMACALVSLAAQKRIKRNLAMTGELTLSGKVLRVGGIKEKLIAAIREGLDTVVLPLANEPDFTQLDDSIKSKLKIIFVDDFHQVYDAVFEHD